MEIMTQDQYRAYREDLRKKGYPVIESTTLLPQQENQYGRALKITDPKLIQKNFYG